MGIYARSDLDDVLLLFQNVTYGSGYRHDEKNTVWLRIVTANEYIFIKDMSIIL
jgi:hypothetical protein